MNLKSLQPTLTAPSLLLVLSGAAFGGALDDFEKDATQDRGAEEQASNQQDCQSASECDEDDHSGNFCIDIVSSIFGSVTDAILTVGSHNTEVRASSNNSNTYITPREPGSPLLPLLRLDGSRHDLNNGLLGDDVRIELARSLLGVQARVTNFKETNPSDSLKLTSIHGLYRLSYGNTVGINLGLGISNLDGNSSTTGFSFTIPVYWHFHENLGIEYKPTFSQFNGTDVIDSDASLMFTYHAASLMLGHRTISSPNESLSGTYIGLSIRK